MCYRIIRPLLFQLEPELAHEITFKILKTCYRPWLIQSYLNHFPKKPRELWGLRFPNPVGLAAGLDKNGDYIDVLLGLGFGFIEVGTVTPRPQTGNPKPRLFRIPAAHALINRLGFNNLGVDYLVQQLQKRQFKPHSLSGIVGVNIGKNRDTPLNKAIEDYRECFIKVYPYADYITMNISSPNTPELRQLQKPGYLNELLSELLLTRQQLINQSQRHVPLVIKIAPDLQGQELDELITTLLRHPIDGVIATNTTIDHDGVLAHPHGGEQGGVSGKPLFSASTHMVAELQDYFANKIPIIAAGGILSAKDALAKFVAGASLVQIYTGLIYRGPRLIRDIVKQIE